ncbi:MAG: response regulator [Chloroflexi bacterium]|nr:response regulator [Chloroflexota bacterium]MDA1174324.1 response regulator [Chloroflexota bacterium]
MPIKILSVDDEPIVYRIIEATLGIDPRFSLIAAADGDEAIVQAMQEKPDVVLLDVDLPGKNGFEVCKAIKADPETSGAVVVMLTAMAQPSDKQKRIDAGADDYLPKPFSPAVLLDKLDEIAARLGAPSS